MVPSRAYGVRALLDRSPRARQEELAPTIESDSFDFMRHYVLHERAVAFQIPIGLDPARDGIVARALPERDVPRGELLIGRLRGRTLPIAAARFIKRAADALDRSASDAFRATVR